MKIKTLLRYSYRVVEILLILSITACVFAGCKGTSQKSFLDTEVQQKSLSEIATETVETYSLTTEEQTTVRNGNEFSIKVFKKIAKEEGENNVFVSTIGMYYSLNIINNGASGSTQQEICNVLNIAPTDVERINKLCHRFTIGQAKVIEDDFLGPSSYMRTATLFQAGERVDIDKSFQDILEHDYFASIVKGKVDSAMQQRINKWCSEQTEGLLNGLQIKEIGDESANLLMANFFNGRWVQKFDKGDTKEEPFYGGISSKVDMMNQTESERVFSYAKLNGFSLLRIPYVGDYLLFIILPDKVGGLTALLQHFNGEKLRSAISQLKSYDHIYVKLPKFNIDYSFKANNFLTSLGLSKAFSDNAELTQIQSEPMNIKEILQNTKVILDEDGTRVSAITSSSFATKCEIANPTKAYFYADHPFFFIIQDPFGNYCFMGTFYGNN